MSLELRILLLICTLFSSNFIGVAVQVHAMSPTTSSATISNAARSPTVIKRILVTGANKGIGKAICERLLTEYDDTCVILGSRDLSRGEAAAQDLRATLQALANKKDDDGNNKNENGHFSSDRQRVQVLQLDTSSDASVQAAAAKLAAEGGGSADLYGIINNAGVSSVSQYFCLRGPTTMCTVLEMMHAIVSEAPAPC
jgi:NAD(P)-dependent dehydrogenase (short-subunit alcohol dehydrogenase family)